MSLPKVNLLSRGISKSIPAKRHDLPEATGADEDTALDALRRVVLAGSASLGPKAKATIDEAAAWVKTQNPKGWVLAVVGYGDSTGNSQRKIDLSERRANAVIYYIVSK